jgi:hypothetical protein
MSERRPPSGASGQGDGAERLLEIITRPEPLPRSEGGLLIAWYRESGATIPFDEWCDPAARHLGAVFESSVDLTTIEGAVVTFAQARAGADHTAAEVAADLVALVRLAWPSAGHEWDGWIDPVGLLARALGAWATERVAVAASVDCVDPASGLVTAKFLERRVHELHAQCDALGLSPPMTFGSVVVQLGLSAVAAPDRMEVRVAAGRILADRFRAGETVAALSSSRTASRMAAVMPAYGIDRAMAVLRADLATLAEDGGVVLQVGRLPFGADAGRTFKALAGTHLGD